ncbi:MAG: hypothetical protein NVSMB64_09590 [Candidatus Velthaea sp.]
MTIMRIKSLFFSGALLAAGCSGGQPASSVPPTLPQSAPEVRAEQGVPALPVLADDGLATTLAHVTVSVKVPIAATNARSVGVSANGAAAAFVDVSATASGCVKGTGSIARTCTATLNEPSGSDTFSLKSFTGSSGTGTLLASATLSQAISTTSANALKIVLGGSVASIRLALTNAAPPGCGATAASALLDSAFDSTQDVILGSYANAVTFTDSDTTGNTSVAPGSVSSSSTVATVTYRGRATAATFGATAAGVAASSVTSATLTPAPMLYAANFSGNTGAASITVYPATAHGNVAPLRKIQGSSTKLNAPYGVTHDSFCNIWVGDALPGSGAAVLYKFAAGANGNVAPVATVTGSNTGLSGPSQLGSDRTDHVYVANQNGSGNILVFPSTANGNIAPSRIITSSAISQPYGVAVDGSGKIYVANETGASVAVFAASANGASTPVALIAGSNTDLQSPVSVAVDGAGKIYIHDVKFSDDHVGVFAAGANGNVVPLAKITTTSFDRYGIAVDPAGSLYWAISKDFSGDAGPAVFVYPPGANGSGAPKAAIDGSNTVLNETYISL